MNEATLPNFDWANRTTLHPLGVAAILVLGLALLVLPRRWAVLPMAVMACYIAPAQRIVILSLDFDLLRVLVLVGWTRLLLRRETMGFCWKSLDYLLITWAAVGTLIYTLSLGTSDALMFKLGVSFDAVGMYFLFRCLIRNRDDVACVARSFILVAGPVALAFGLEHATGRNIFAAFGYVPETTLSRGGYLRCQGAFAHPILAGCFWAALMPLIGARAWHGTGSRIEALFGLAAAGLIILLCASSTPVAAVLLGLAAAAFYPLRRSMNWIAWAGILLIVQVHLLMKAPVWHLMSRIDFLGGSTGWHRYYLVNEAVKRFDEWWLLGSPSTAHWGTGLFDVTNQYVLEATRGGVWTLILFGMILLAAFRAVGRLVRAAGADRHASVLAWALGVALFIHAANFLAVSYFGQIIMVWYLLLAMIASLSPVTETARWVPASQVARYRQLGYRRGRTFCQHVMT